MLLRARWIVEAGAPPVEDGALVVSGGIIREVGRWRDVRPHHTGRPVDLGEVLLFPGWVNAHAHLEYTRLLGHIPPPRSFSGWIQSILTAKAQLSAADYEQGWMEGAWQLVATGTTTVANIESWTDPVVSLRAWAPLRVFSFHEMTGIRSGRPGPGIVSDALERMAAWPRVRGGRGLSPHAPYSTLPDLRQAACLAARRHRLPLAIHVAESVEEFDMFMYRRGPMHDWLRSQRPMEDCGRGSPVQMVDEGGLLTPRTLVVHANYLWHPDAARLADTGSSVVHCPRSHAYFRHQRFPRRELTAAGVRICLGTDSLASVVWPPPRKAARPVHPLSMFEEFHALFARDSTATPQQVLAMATSHGAQALGQEGRLGQIRVGHQADFAVIPYSGTGNAAVETLVRHRGAVAGTAVGGRWMWLEPGYQSALGLPSPASGIGIHPQPHHSPASP